jgi:NADH:ubiquinone oxidoreductase subunit 5 (subunit L)/multisubunit Na+/H+ antiporter MnhA subunit
MFIIIFFGACGKSGTIWTSMHGYLMLMEGPTPDISFITMQLQWVTAGVYLDYKKFFFILNIHN